MLVAYQLRIAHTIPLHNRDSAMKDTTIATALLVVDVQRSFEKMPFWSENGLMEYQRAQNELIKHARAHDWPVVFVYHISRGPFALDSSLVVPTDWIDRRPEDAVFYKRVHNALSESGLQAWLDHRGIGHLVISGIRTEQCCETTARYASDAGFEVDFVLDATHTFAMTDVHKQLVSAAEIKSRTAMVLRQRFATVSDTSTFTSKVPAGSFNRHCPRSRKPVSSDSIVDYRGYSVGFCNTGCSSSFANDPAASGMDCLYFDRLIARHSARAAYLENEAR